MQESPLVANGLSRFGLENIDELGKHVFKEMVFLALVELRKVHANELPKNENELLELTGINRNTLYGRIMDVAGYWSNDVMDAFRCYVLEENDIHTMDEFYVNGTLNVFTAIYNWLSEYGWSFREEAVNK